MTSAAEPESPPAADAPAASLAIVFTGSGSEYFRIWIVNMLLTLVTVGLYYPWAKVRRLRYFYSNTLVGGAALHFHGNPKTMLKGTLLVALLFGMYSMSGYFSPKAGLVALVLLAAVMPALLRASWHFRLANTSWRGLRFRFNGNVSEAYWAVLPMYVPTILIVGLTTLAPAVDQGIVPSWFWWSFLAITVLTILMAPWSLWKLKHYQHNNYVFSHLQTRLTATAGVFYQLGLKIIGMTFLFTVLMLILTLLVGFITAVIAGLMLRHSHGSIWRILLNYLPIMVVFSAVVAVQPYAITRTQNLVWDHTGNGDLRFHSDLRFKSMLWLTLKNWLLVLLTLGLYWPFAAVAMARIRLQATHISSYIDPDTLVGQPAGNGSAAVGDAAGDVLGIDLGF